MSELIERIRSRIVEEGDCWNWTGAMQSCGVSPVMNWKRKIGSVRRFILYERGGNQPRLIATYNCGNPMCVNPEHTVWTTRGKVQRRTTVEQSYQNNVIRRKKLSDKARAKGKLTLELATEIRTLDGNQHQIAAQYGISQATVSAIKRGKTWQSYGGNPFAGLGAL